MNIACAIGVMLCMPAPRYEQAQPVDDIAQLLAVDAPHGAHMDCTHNLNFEDARQGNSPSLSTCSVGKQSRPSGHRASCKYAKMFTAKIGTSRRSSCTVDMHRWLYRGCPTSELIMVREPWFAVDATVTAHDLQKVPTENL
jgi:hypothetical protein